MKITLNRDTVAERLNSFTPDNYLYIWGIMKGIALGVGTLSIITFRFPLDAPQIAFWFGSVAAIMVSHATTSRGILLTSFRYNSLDTVIPLAMGTVECLLFLVLQRSEDNPVPLEYWYWLLALHAFLAICLVANRRRLTRPDDFDPELKKLAEDCREWLQRDIIGASLFTVTIAGIGLVMTRWVIPRYPTAAWWQWLVGVFTIAVFGKVLFDAESQRRRAVSFLQNLTDDSKANP